MKYYPVLLLAYVSVSTLHALEKYEHFNGPGCKDAIITTLHAHIDDKNILLTPNDLNSIEKRIQACCPTDTEVQELYNRMRVKNCVNMLDTFGSNTNKVSDLFKLRKSYPDVYQLFYTMQPTEIINEVNRLIIQQPSALSPEDIAFCHEKIVAIWGEDVKNQIVVAV